MAVTIRDVDRGFRALVKAITKSKGAVTVGVHAQEGAKSHKSKAKGAPATVLEIAIWNEFGTDKIPERSFIRAWVDENREQVQRWISSLTEQVLKGKIDKEKCLHLLGLKIQGEIQKRIANGIPPPNSPVTIARKGSDKPLIDTGQLRASIHYKVVPET